jgi:hypothetical protein
MVRFSTNQGAHSEASLTPSLREALTRYFGTCEKDNNALDMLWLFSHNTLAYIRVVGDNLGFMLLSVTLS